MAKTRTLWCCAQCGHNQAKWSGQCPQCHEWNTLHEEVEVPESARRFVAPSASNARPMRLKEVSLEATSRHCTTLKEFDRLVGGGLVLGSLSLIGGEPGIGKSTLLLQVANALGQKGLTVLYICGEESIEQSSARAQRLGIDTDHLFFLNETHFTPIKAHIEALNPQVVIVDSIQIVYKGELASAPGTVSQVRETAMEFMHLAKGRSITTILVGHVTKSGEIAGPRVLEHIVDTVLYFEGDKQQNYRMLRVIKNRFGPTDEIGVFQMTARGLTEVANPSEIFLEERRQGSPGSVIIPTLEGSRPFLIEVQALVTATSYPTPSRRCTGIHQNRLALLLAVLEKRLKFRLYSCDVFVSIAGGLQINEPSIDLGVALAISSSHCNQHLPYDTVAIGEVGLGGEIRSVAKIESRIKEAVRMGFGHCIIPKRNLKGLPTELRSSLRITAVDLVEEAINALFSSS